MLSSTSPTFPHQKVGVIQFYDNEMKCNHLFFLFIIIFFKDLKFQEKD